MTDIAKDRYAVMGDPVEHSKSPRIHALFAAQTHQSMAYTAIRVSLHDLPGMAADFQRQGGKGLNITVPLKEAAYRLAARYSERARRARAVNTLIVGPGGDWDGENTDGIGLLRDLQANLAVTLAGARIVLIGAGGAARGVLGPLLEAGPGVLVLANRTVDRARGLAAEFSDLGPVTASGFDELQGGTWDVVINATAASLSDAVPAIPAAAVTGSLCYDMMYGDRPTAFMTWAGEHGAARATDGLGMLVEQAAESFYLWRGVRPDAVPVLQRLRTERGF